VLTYDRALRAARALFLECSTVDMPSLARRLAVGRATLYRVARSRERLIGDVIWSFGERTLAMAREETTATGVEGVIELAQRFNSYVVGFEPLRAFVRAEPMTAVHVLFTPAGDVHRRFVDAWTEIFRNAIDNEGLHAALDAADLAYVFVRIGESVLYSDLLAGREPDIELAAVVQRALLRPL
jgi:hypothetical protein